MAVTIQNRISELCRVQGITPYRLAKKIGRQPNTITRLINGESEGSDTLKAEICLGLGQPLEKVFFIASENSPENNSQNAL